MFRVPMCVLRVVYSVSFCFLVLFLLLQSRLNFGKLYQLRDGTRGLQMRKYDDGRDVPGTTRYHRSCHYDEAGWL